MPEADFPTFELLPADADDFSPEAELAASIDPEDIAPATSEDETKPLGSSWQVDPETGQMGSRPLRVTGTDAVVAWATVALRTPLHEHAIFSDEFGMQKPDRLIGTVDDPENRASYIADIRATLLVYDRITDVRDFLFLTDADDELAFIDATIVVDDDTEVRLEGIPLLS